jgi:pimeloyl-ACP methyl ester carboxylesterase
MPHTDIEFKTSDGVVLRGWFYLPDPAPTTPLPCLVMSHGFSALKEMDLNLFAERFVKDLAITCLVFDNRGFGDSDHGPNQHRHEIIPAVQTADISDAITYAQSRSEVNPDKIAIWGSSYSGGHVLQVGAVDRRVKAVLSQVPCVNGWDNFNRLVRPDFAVNTNKLFQEGKFLSIINPLMLIIRSSQPNGWKRSHHGARCGREPSSAIRTSNPRQFRFLYQLVQKVKLEERSYSEIVSLFLYS